jgi:hypothetical protein
MGLLLLAATSAFLSEREDGALVLSGAEYSWLLAGADVRLVIIQVISF